MSSRMDFLEEQARQRPDSTVAIGLRAIQDELWAKKHKRQAAVRAFFAGLVNRKH